MELFFDGPDGVLFVKKVTSIEEAMRAIPTIVLDKIYYYRCWNSKFNNRPAICIDYGNHSYFFYVVGGQM